VAHLVHSIEAKLAMYQVNYQVNCHVNWDGLLGWDVIRAFHLEMDGPTGLLKVF